MNPCPYCNASRSTGSTYCAQCGGTAAALEALPEIGPPLEAELRRLLAEGRKIEAIKQLRAATGAGLAEAKLAVDRLEAGAELSRVHEGLADPLEHARLEELLRAGRKIEAIKLYRVHTGAGLKEAKDAVEALGIVPEAGSKSGCLGVVILLAIGTALVASL